MAMAAQQRQWVNVVSVNGNGVGGGGGGGGGGAFSVATAAIAVFLLSPHLPHCLIVVLIVPRREGAMRPLLSCRQECASL